MKPLYAHLLVLFTFMVVVAGCTQPGNSPAPVLPPEYPSVSPSPTIPVSAAETTTGVTSVSPGATVSPPPENVTSSFPEASPTISTTVSALSPPGGTGYRRLQDPFYTVEYPASWMNNQSSIPLHEYTHYPVTGCRVATAYNLNQDLRMFYPEGGGSALFYVSVVNSDRDIWPRDESGNIDYADIVNSILGDPTHCANTPAGSFTISGVNRVPLGGVSFDGTRVDFGKIDSLGKTMGKGSMYVVTGTRRHGVFTYYSATGESDAWRPTADYLFNLITLDPNF